MVRHEQDVLVPLAKRGQMNGDHVQAIKQVLPKPPLGHLFLQVPVGGRDNAHIHLGGGHRTHSLELFFLNDTQDLDLQGQVQLPDLVQENGPAVGKFETSGPGSNGVGKSPFFMTEKFGLDEFLRDRAAVHRNEGFIPSPAVAMQGADQEFFARSGLSGHQNRAVR